MERDAVLTSKPPSAQLNIVSSAFTQTELLQKEVRARARPRLRDSRRRRKNARWCYSSVSVLFDLSLIHI